MSSVVRLQFSRAGEREGVPLHTDTEYRVRINGGPIGTFRAPWNEAELQQKIQILRNKSGTRPTSKVLEEMGRALGKVLFDIAGLDAELARGSVLELQLDYPELARIPWELATRNVFPYHHLLKDDVSIVRNVPSLVQDHDAQWPTGRNRALELLFVWSEREGLPVPHEKHREALAQVCNQYGVDLKCRELRNLAELAKLFSGPPPIHFHFVHILAHGTLTDEGDWGLAFADGTVKGKQLAEALRAGNKTPALVTLSACDSAGEPDNSFGSPAYQLHVHGIPFVVASQFRLRESSSTESTKRIYNQLLGGGHLRDLLSGIRAQLAAADNEAWANEVVYNRYRFEALDDLAMVARQQAVLRRANAIDRKAKDATGAKLVEMIQALDEETAKLHELLAEQRKRGAANGAIAETCGLMGSMQRRKARLGVEPGGESKADLRHACSYYRNGLHADLNSHFCGINAVHLLLRLGEREEAEKLIPTVRLAAESQIASGADFWARATAGELEVYARNERAAEGHFDEFVRAVEREVGGNRAIASTLRSPLRQLEEIEKLFGDAAVRQAASSAREIVRAAIRRTGEEV